VAYSVCQPDIIVAVGISPFTNSEIDDLITLISHLTVFQ